jgi:hypothetical protein
MTGDPRDRGVNFPVAADGSRSSTALALGVLQDAVRAHDPDLVRDLGSVSDWRRDYPVFFERVVRAEARSGAAALDIARSGLQSARGRFVEVADDGTERPLTGETSGARTDAPRAPFGTAEIRGTDERVRELVIPYRGESLRGVALLRQLDDWVHRGITEPSLADAIGAVVRNPEWLDLRDRCFAMVGAGAQMGPVTQLLDWGATVAAVDLPRPPIWAGLAEAARQSAGRLLVPLRTADPTDLVEAAGVDLLREPAALLDWLTEAPGPLTVGNYVYADGALFVRVSMAFDALFTGLRERRDDLSATYLATPADVFLVPITALDMARRRHHEEPSRLVAAGRLVHAASRGRWFKPNYTDRAIIETPTERFGIVNAFIVAQGPNYAMAKRLQRWRMTLARAEGLLTSVHVAPPTRTRSVHSNPMMQERQQLTAPLGIETFDPVTTETIAAAILVHDLRNPAAPANPRTPLGHPHEAFMFAANPGGRWRVPFDLNSSVPPLHDAAVVAQHATRAAHGLVRGVRGIPELAGRRRRPAPGPSR